jgi:hypothetical protein
LEDPSKKWKVVKYSKKLNSVFRGHLMCMNAPLGKEEEFFT